MQDRGVKPYVLGIDSGGTKYLVRAAAMDGTALGEHLGPACSHYHYPLPEASRRIAESLTRCLSVFGGRPEDCRCIVCGTTGYDSPEDGLIIRGLYEGLTGFSCPILCMNDVELAFRVACGNTGVMILAGTGSICFARNAGGESLRVGGWPIAAFGDEGSGRYIDSLALRHLSLWMDGCREDSALLRAIREATGVSTRKGLMDYGVRLQKEEIPSPGLGPAVTRAAESGDRHAAEILRDAAACLFRMGSEAIRRLRMDREDDLPVGIWGSVLMRSAPVRDELARLLREAFPNARLCLPGRDAAQGAVEMALERASGFQGG